MAEQKKPMENNDKKPEGFRGKMPPVKKGTFGRLLKYVGAHYKLEMIVVLICIVIVAVSSVISTMFMQRLIDDCILPGIDAGIEAVAGIMGRIIASMAIIYLLGVVAGFLRARIMAKVTQGTLHNLREDMFNTMETLPVRYFDTHTHGEIMSTYTNDTDTIRQVIGQSLPTLIQSVLSIVSIFLMMVNYSIWLTIAVILILILMTKVSKKFAGTSAKYMMAQQKSLAKEEGFIEEMMEGQKVVKVFCHEEENKKEFARLNQQLFSDGETANKAGNVLMPILANIGNLMYVLLAFIGGIMVILKTPNLQLTGFSVVTIGIIVSFLGMSRQLSQTVGQISMQVTMIAMGLAGAARVFELMDQEPEQDEGYVTLVNAKYDENGQLQETDEKTGMWAWRHFHKQSDQSVTYRKLEGDVEMVEVDFGYTPDKMVLHDITLYAKPGQKIAFVGATGAGKTTITNLINRFYDIPDGKIRYDGININKICKPDLRHSLGVVLQDVNLFSGTVMDNIRYGRLDATDEECIAAAKLANADDFITRLPEGYQTMLTGNGSQLSQGQRQLLSIARAAVADPPVMILDEATSSIDTRTEALVQKGMDNLMKGRTVFVISHRLSTVRNSDAIMVLDHGRIIERGTHDDLIAQKGTYYQLYTGAFELE